MTKNSPQCYGPQEMALLKGISPEAVNWTAITWELVKTSTGSRKQFLQFILVPGSMIVRSVLGNRVTEPIGSDYRIETPERNGSQDFLSQVQSLTRDYLESGRWSWSQQPYLCDFTENDLHLWFMEQLNPFGYDPAETLGDVVAHGIGPHEGVFFDHLNKCHPVG